jgi:ribosomal protein S18 acetylase RimI-like enzyme
VGYEKWNSRMRVWEFLVKEEVRRKGIGKMLMGLAVKTAKERGARMLVLETQSCNVPAITFYLRQNFNLIGFDSTAYSNEDIEKKEVRLEFGLPL